MMSEYKTEYNNRVLEDIGKNYNAIEDMSIEELRAHQKARHERITAELKLLNLSSEPKAA